MTHDTKYDINVLPWGWVVGAKWKRVQKLLDNPGNVSSDELVAVLRSLDFEEKGGKGSHRCFKHPALPRVKLTVPKQDPLRRAYVTKAIEAICDLLDAEDYDE